MEIKAIVIEDEIPARITLNSYLKKYFPNVRVVKEVSTVREGVSIINNTKADILFLDVQLKDGLGIEILNKAKQIDKLKIIFTTAHDNFTLEAFQYKAFGYLLKPLDPIDFKDIMNRALKDLIYSDQSSAKIKIPTKYGHVELSVFDIVRCQAESNYTKIHTKDNKAFVLSKTLKYVEEELLSSDYFVRIHNSHLINLNFIDKSSMTSTTIKLLNSEKIPVSRGKRQDLINKLNELSSLGRDLT